MIRMIQSKSSSQAKAYFNDALTKADYYLGNDQELQGKFHGLIAERLGLETEATREAFYDLCENLNPSTGGTLTQRNVDQRTVGYDINFHCPKSVSLIHSLSKDDHILKAFEASVKETMKDIEADSKTRIRKKGQYDDRNTGELVWAEFIHQTARPVNDALPDPHLHAHCFTFNVTWDEKEKQFKAGQFRDIKRDMPYYEARFHKRLADKLTELGYVIRKTDKFFEIEGVPQEAIDLFSKRTNEIGQIAKEKGITDAKELDALGARTRAKKQKGHTMSELKSEWIQQLKQVGLDQTQATIRHSANNQTEAVAPERCVDYALRDRFERVSVMQDRRVLETSYRHALGKNVSLDAITKAFIDDKRIIRVKEKWRTVCTTKEVLAEEKHMVDLANKARGKFMPLYRETPEIDLKGEQLEAARHVLTTTHGVSIIKGRAGSGKTTLMKEVVDFMERGDCKVTMVAPTAQASRGVLRDEGFEHADTVARLLVDKELQDGLQNGALLVDEAGLLGTRDMTSLLDLAARKNARLVLVGDTRQHASVVRGDALRILNTVGGIRSAEVSRIFRQRNKEYREAVQSLSDGKVKEAFDRLDGLQAIKSINPLKPNDTLVDDYLSAVKKGKSALIVSPTHKQGEETTEAIRKKLREVKKIGKKEIKATRLVNLNMTEAEKNDARNFKPGQVIQFNQNMKGAKRGSTWTVASVQGNNIEATDTDWKMITVPLSESHKIDVYQKHEIGLSKGDKIRVTKNGFDMDKKRLNNGQMLEVVSVNKKGNIKVRNCASKVDYSLPQSFGHIAHAHCITSHASQGKTVDEVFIVQPSATFPATDMKQFYVSVSRGRDAVHIYTDDKNALLDHALQIGDRQSALELIGNNQSKERAEQISRETLNKQKSNEAKARSVGKSQPVKQARSYEREPEI